MKPEAIFQEEFKKLTKEQRQAVETVEGPVMVIAGPGTGKTHVLTLRIANILRTTQATPDTILVLTFTDSASRTLRRRLTTLIGEETARKVTITTFHGFAELVRAEYPDSFSEKADYRLMGGVETTLLLRAAIDKSELNILRPAKSPYTYLKDLAGLYDSLSREGMSLEEYRAWGKRGAKELAVDESLQYKRGTHAGELTKAGLGKVARFDRVEEAASIFERYQQLKTERSLVDFSDVLFGIIEQITNDEGLRSDLQERYQYILADEHQDANALQHRLLELLAYDDYPNLFVVGDERQTVYRFQGADVSAFKNFTKLFPRAVVITLTSSFRSYQHILDTAHKIIIHTGTHSSLNAERKNTEECVSLIVADDPLDERGRITVIIEQLIKDGVPPHEIAVIARTNDTADLFAQALSARGLPILRAGDLSLTDRPLMRVLMALMSYVADPTQLGSLREALLSPWWNLPIADLLIFLRTTNDKNLVGELNKVYPEVANTIANLVKEALVQTPIACFSYIFTESGARDYFLSHSEHLDDITIIRTLMMHLESVVLLTESTTFAEAFATFSLAREHGLSPIKISVTEREGFITVITAHKSKGMEFRYVFIPNCTENTWEKGGRASKIPSPFENKQSLADVQRLFYVALTRAKDRAYFSYARVSAEGRDRLPTDLLPDGITELDIKGDVLPLLHMSISAPKKIRELIEYYLATKGLSPSAINDYLKSPPVFFARRVLRIQEPPIGALIYGNAMHAALAAALSGVSTDEANVILERVFTRSLLPRDATFEKLRVEAHSTLNAVLPELSTLGTPKYIEKVFSMTRIVDNIPVIFSGHIDAVFTKNGQLVVTDFKTGSSISAKDEAYTRQLALYAAMLTAQKETVTSGLLLGLSEKGIKSVPVPVDEAAQESALADGDTVVRELRSSKWRRGAASEYDALLALLDDKPR